VTTEAYSVAEDPSVRAVLANNFVDHLIFVSERDCTDEMMDGPSVVSKHMKNFKVPTEQVAFIS
jgi:hypothetical protein